VFAPFNPSWEVPFPRRKSVARSMRKAKDARAVLKEENKKSRLKQRLL
jgi:hypothetical protein